MNEELRQAILGTPNASDLRDLVPTPEWPTVNGQVFVRTLTLPERTQYMAEIRAQVLAPEVQADHNGAAAQEVRDAAGVKLAILTMCDSNGDTLMDLEDLEVLAKKHWAPVNRIIDAAANRNGLTKAALDALKNVSPSAATSA